MEPLKVTEMIVSHRMICPCGRTALQMTEEQNTQYYEAISKRRETRSIPKREEDKPTVEALPRIERVSTTHDDEMEIRTYDFLR